MRDGIRSLLPMVFCCATFLMTACASDPYHYGTRHGQLDTSKAPAMPRQVLVGQPNAFLDASDWIWPGSLLSKLLLWNKKVDNHQISQETIAQLETYLEANALNDVQVLVNRYSPGNQWRRLFKNRHVGAGWRYTMGILSVSFYTILPGRFFGGDAYNTYTNTIYLYSDVPAIALHEGGHAKDLAKRKYKGTHAALYNLPFASLYYEANATSDALGYLRCQGRREQQEDAYKLLYPAYSTYVFGNINSLTPDPLWNLGVIPGHIAGRLAAANVTEDKKCGPVMAATEE